MGQPATPAREALPRPTIGVVIPAYNAADYVEGALESVLAQSRPADEIVVVDDGSEDDTAAVAEAVDPAVRVVRADHGGAAAARNAGTEHICSTWIAYLDSDDRWDGDKLKIFEEVIRTGMRPGLIFSDFRRRNLETGATRSKTNTDIFPWVLEWPAEVEEGRHPVHRFGPRQALELLIRGYPVFPSSALVRRDLLERVGGWDPRFIRSQDLEVWLRLARLEGMAYVDRVLTTVHVREGHGTPYDWIGRQLEWDIRVLDHHTRSGGFPPAERKLLREYVGLRTVWRGDLARRHGRWWDAFRWYARAMRHLRQVPRSLHRLAVTLPKLPEAVLRRE